jgi:hypothetical protein
MVLMLMNVPVVTAPKSYLVDTVLTLLLIVSTMLPAQDAMMMVLTIALHALMVMSW